MSQEALISRVNGRDCQQLSLFDRGFQFGDSLFETIRFYNHCCPLWSIHSKRLELGCNRLGIEFPADLLDSEYQYLCQYLQSLGKRDALVKFQLSRGESLRGYGRVNGSANLVSLAFNAEPFSQQSQAMNPLSVELSSVRLAQQPLLAGLKHGNRLEQVIARQQLSQDCDDAILLDTAGNVVEAISSNVFFLHQGDWLTPSLEQAGVAGVVRELMLEANAVQVADFEVKVPTLLSSDGICLANSVQGIRAVKHLQCVESGGQSERRWQDFKGWQYLSQNYTERFSLPAH